MERIAALTVKELKHIRRDPRSLIMVLFFPMLMLILFAYAITFDIREVPTALFDADRSAESRGLILSLSSSGYFRMIPVGSYRAAEEKLNSGEAWAALIIPAGFARRIDRGETASIQILVDGSDSNTASQVVAYLKGALIRYSGKLLFKKSLREGGLMNGSPISFRPRLWYNPDLKSPNFLIPGLIGLIMMVIGVMLASLSIAREEEDGTLEGIRVSPISSLEFIVGKLLPYILIAIAELVLILIAGITIFDLPFRGSFSLLFLLSLIFFVSILGMGLLISTIARTQQMAWLLSLLLTFLPSLILSGFIFPIRNMPYFVQLITYLLPARYFIVILRGIILKGVGLSQLKMQVVYLVVLGSTFMVASILRFRKKIA
ncbi:MAG: ABC transporter permease [Acidobacteria bacterium]|nr:ABC transporter permease [Acidobacteriota bacterium]